MRSSHTFFLHNYTVVPISREGASGADVGRREGMGITWIVVDERDWHDCILFILYNARWC